MTAIKWNMEGLWGGRTGRTVARSEDGWWQVCETYARAALSAALPAPLEGGDK